MTDNPIYDQLHTVDDAPPEVAIPSDVHVWTDDDGLSIADAPEVNGTGDQTGGMGPL